MKQTNVITIIKIVAVIMLFWALADNPYGYYQILRWVICGLSGYLAYSAYNEKKNAWAWIFGILAILFNPILPIYLDRDTWSVIDAITAVIIFISIFKMKIVAKKDANH